MISTAWQNLKIVRKGLILVGILVVFEMFFVGMLASLLNQASDAAAKESYYSNVSGRTSQLYEQSFAIHANLLCAVWGAGSKYGRRVREALVETNKEYESLEPLIKDNPLYQSRLQHCRELTRQATPLIMQVLKLAEFGRLTEAYQLFTSAEFVEKKKPVLAALYSFIQEQEPIIDENVLATLKANESVKKWIMVGVGANILVAITLFLLLVRGIIRRLDVVLDNTALLAKDKPLLPPLKGTDEVGELDRVFHHMAEVLAKARKREQSLIDNASDVICSLDANGNFLKVSPASLTVWGYESEQLIAQPLTDLVYSEDVSVVLEALQHMVSGTRDLSFECRIRHKWSQAVLNMFWSAHWSELDRCIFAVVHDVTEHKRAEELLRTSEERIRTVLNNTLIGLFTLNSNGLIEQANPRAEELVQYNSNELANKELSYVFEQTTENGGDLLTALRESSAIEGNALRKGGQVLPVELSLAEFKAADGMKLLVNVIDITQRRQVEQMKAEFVSTVSDNLRLPLAAVRQFLEKVAETDYSDGLTDRGKQGAGLAMRNVGRLLRMTNDLVDVATFESGNLVLECAPCELSGILERSVEAVRVFAEKHSVKVEHDTVSVSIFADQDRLERVVVNLLSNAIKFSPEGASVRIAAEVEPEQVFVSVIDRGRGIPSTHIDVIFERFGQVSATDATQKGGTGLGLAICKAIIEQHGGKIGVDSEEGKGSTFWFRLPRFASR
jgi:PAS domain S-box-containing protein